MGFARKSSLSIRETSDLGQLPKCAEPNNYIKITLERILIICSINSVMEMMRNAKNRLGRSSGRGYFLLYFVFFALLFCETNGG